MEDTPSSLSLMFRTSVKSHQLTALFRQHGPEQPAESVLSKRKRSAFLCSGLASLYQSIGGERAPPLFGQQGMDLLLADRSTVGPRLYFPSKVCPHLCGKPSGRRERFSKKSGSSPALCSLFFSFSFSFLSFFSLVIYPL